MDSSVSRSASDIELYVYFRAKEGSKGYNIVPVGVTNEEIDAKTRTM
jgi:hypothetical protein